MTRVLKWVTALTLIASPAFGYEDSFSYYYGNPSPMVNCDTPSYNYAPTTAEPSRGMEHEKEVEYLYGRNVLGFVDEMQEPAPMADSADSMPYGWSLRAPIAGN